MHKLIKMEMKKMKMGGFMKGAIIADAVLMGFLILMLLVDTDEGTCTFANFADCFTVVDSLTRMVFMVFSGVLVSKLIIEEYKDKTIALMFTYPINRKAIFASKLIIILVFTFISIVTSRIVITTFLYMLNMSIHFLPDLLTVNQLIKHIYMGIIYDLSISSIGLIPLFFGMRKKSVRTTIVSSIIIACFLNSSSGGFSVISVIAIPILLTILGLIIAYLSIRNIEHRDIY